VKRIVDRALAVLGEVIIGAGGSQYVVVAGRDEARGVIGIDMSEADEQLTLSELLRRLEARSREDVAGLRIRTSANLFEATQREYEERRQGVVPAGPEPPREYSEPHRAVQELENEYVSRIPSLAGMGRNEALRAISQRTGAERLKEARESLGLRMAAETFEALQKEREEASRKGHEEAERKKREEAARKKDEEASQGGRVMVSLKEIEEVWRKYVEDLSREKALRGGRVMVSRKETGEVRRKHDEELSRKEVEENSEPISKRRRISASREVSFGGVMVNDRPRTATARVLEESVCQDVSEMNVDEPGNEQSPREEALRREHQKRLRKEAEDALRRGEEEQRREAEKTWREEIEEARRRERELCIGSRVKRKRRATSTEARVVEVRDNDRPQTVAVTASGESVRDGRRVDELVRSDRESERVRDGEGRSRGSRAGMTGEATAPRKGSSVIPEEGVGEDGNEQELLGRILHGLEEEFAENKLLSDGRMWCKAVTHERKVSTVQEFYTALHDKKTLPLHTCVVCYRKYGSIELRQVDWRRWVGSGLGSRSQFDCRRCFPDGEMVAACASCLKESERGSLSAAARLHGQLGCEHMYPEELKGLTPVEEKLISLNSCYGFIARYAVQEGRRQSTTYPKHVKGHITVFPNNVQELVSNVLPHPLLKVMDDIHVSWHGRVKPTPWDLSALLSVRRHVVEKALVWLKRNNPHYAGIEIDTAEMESWEAPQHGVPAQIYERLELNQPLASEKARTANVVPPTERGFELGEAVDVREVLATLNEDATLEVEETDVGVDVEIDGGAKATIHEIGASGMFALDEQPDVADADKVMYACDALRPQVRWEGGRENRAATGSTEVRGGDKTEPYIQVSRGEEFADVYDVGFFAKTFPTLFPVGRGGPRQAEESGAEEGQMQGGNASTGTEAAASGLLSSRNMSLESWAKVVLGRHGGRFAMHNVFSFLVFNRLVLWRNRRASMLSVTRKNFPDVERIVRMLSAQRLEAAMVELKESGKTTDKEVNKLLRSLSLYGFRQPMSRESRLSMRRKIKALIVRYGIPAIWFTLNPNDITSLEKRKSSWLS